MYTKPSDDVDNRGTVTNAGDIDNRGTVTNEGENAHGNLNNEESSGALSPTTPIANNPETSAATCSNQLNHMQTTNNDTNTTTVSQDDSYTDDSQHTA